MERPFIGRLGEPLSGSAKDRNAAEQLEVAPYVEFVEMVKRDLEKVDTRMIHRLQAIDQRPPSDGRTPVIACYPRMTRQFTYGMGKLSETTSPGVHLRFTSQ